MTHLGLGVPLATTQVVGHGFYGIHVLACQRRDHVRKGGCRKSATSNVRKSPKPVRDSMSKNKWARRPWRIKNPIKSENASGLARIVRSFIIPTYENALLWHERDLAIPAASASRSRTPQPLPRT